MDAQERNRRWQSSACRLRGVKTTRIKFWDADTARPWSMTSHFTGCPHIEDTAREHGVGFHLCCCHRIVMKHLHGALQRPATAARQSNRTSRLCGHAPRVALAARPALLQEVRAPEHCQK